MPQSFRARLSVPASLLAAAALSFTMAAVHAPPATAGALPDVAAREPGWKHYGTSDAGERDYVMYTRKPAGSAFSAYRLEAEFDAPIDIVAAAATKHMIDPENRQRNMDKTVLERDEFGALIHSHIYISAPFVADRDVVTRVDFLSDPASKTHTLRWRATDEGPPPKSGVIRLDRSDGSWTFIAGPNGTTRAIYMSHTEIAGSLPAWILNGFMSDSMVHSITGLRQAVERELASR
ncbi:MAG: START domain-containing protein [Myxococcota bacterium]|jgi:hypothetical protein|nr:START domain-containing protein [Myxococcota bacterium]